MKTRIFNIFVIIIAVLALSAAMVSEEFSITPGDEFISVQSGDNLEAVAQKLSMTTHDLSSYFKTNGLLYLAITDDAKTQIKISAYSDNFSSEVGDSANLDDETFQKFADTIDNKSQSPATIVLNGDRKFVCLKDVHNDSGGVYTVTQYITIYNNKTFYFVGYNDGEETSPAIKSAFESIEFTTNQPTTTDYTPQLVLIIAAIVVFSIIAIIMLAGIIKNFRASQGEDNVNEH